MILGWLFMLHCGSSCGRYPTVRGFFQFLDDLQDLVAAHDGIVDDESQLGRVFQDDGARHQALDARAMFG